MTCICALVEDDYTYMGCDSASSRGGWGIDAISRSKIFYKEPHFLMGFCGSNRLSQIVEYKTKFKLYRRVLSLEEYMVTDFVDALRESLKEFSKVEVEHEVESLSGETQLLVGFNGRIFDICSSFGLEEHDDFWAIGCGEDLALGSLYSTNKMKPENRIRLALEASSKFSMGVCNPFHIFRMNNKNHKLEEIT